MGNPALKINYSDKDGLHSKGKNTKEKIENTLTSELVIALCTPIGSLKEPVISSIKETLTKEYNYEFEIIKLSEFIVASDEAEPGKTSNFSLFKNKIIEGNRLRGDYSSPSILAELAVKKIYLDRANVSEGSPIPKPEDITSKRKCYLIDSLKNKEELKLLRSVYRDIFYLISVFSPLEEREKNLSKKGLAPQEIKDIINNDEYENNTSGQNVRNTFTEADFFLRVSDRNQEPLSERVDRYIDLIFETNIVTPRPQELAMYTAKSAASGSACLSRQVGATITDKGFDIISSGWNDVPKFGGNLYTSGDENTDGRCFLNEYCSNDKTKDTLTNDVVGSILKALDNSNQLKSNFKKGDLKNTLFEELRSSSKIKDLIEFSRSVHAEMHAIITGSQLSGDKMVGGKLFCTTYPCHNCARHIVVAGITEVYYIEPYVKSLCIELHEDSITENENSEEKKVKLLVYDGVAPRRFLEFFSMNSERKSKGVLNKKNKREVNPKTRLSLQAIPTLEQQAIHSLDEIGYYEKETNQRPK